MNRYDLKGIILLLTLIGFIATIFTEDLLLITIAFIIYFGLTILVMISNIFES